MKTQTSKPARDRASYTDDPNYSRIGTTMDGVGTTTYAYNPIAAPPAWAAASSPVSTPRWRIIC
jgi:hypothetical protein